MLSKVWVHIFEEYCFGFVVSGDTPVEHVTVCLLVWWENPQRKSGTLIVLCGIGMQLNPMTLHCCHGFVM